MEGSVGEPFHSIEYKVEPIGRGDNVGELFIRGESLHSGRMVDGQYIPRSQETRTSWFPPQAISRQHPRRRHVCGMEGRLKEVIINESGENRLCRTSWRTAL